MGADVRVACASDAAAVVAESGAEAEAEGGGGPGGLGLSSGRYDDLAPSGRYLVDPEGLSEYAPWVLRRHAHPLSAVPDG